MTTKTATKKKVKTTVQTGAQREATVIEELEAKLADEELLARANQAKYEDVKDLGLAYVKEIDNLMLNQAQGKIQAGKLLMILGDLTKQFNDMLESK